MGRGKEAASPLSGYFAVILFIKEIPTTLYPKLMEEIL